VLSSQAILVVEDEDLVREIIAEELVDSGYSVLQAGSAEDALALFDQQPVGILFTDIRMPGMDGWALAEEAQRRNPALKVLYTTGFTHERPRPVPNSLYIVKPYRASQIIAAIERLIAGGDSMGADPA
jgi:CheY-like chemotaxis protein